MARCQLPFSLNVILKPQWPRFLAKLERKRAQLEQAGALRFVRPRIDGANVVATGNPPGNINEHIGDASGAMVNKLGRTPSDLPDRFDLDIDVEAEGDSEVSPELVNNEPLASGGQLSAPSGRAKNKRQPRVSSSLPDASDPSSSNAVRAPHPTNST